MEQSDVVLVFCDIFNSTTDLAKALIATLIKQQESNKLVYLFDDIASNAVAWQKKLADSGLTIGQFIGISQLENQTSTDFTILEQRITNAGLQRSYRVLHSLEKSILDVERVLIHEVEAAQFYWKEGSVFSSFVVLGFFAMLAVFAEVAGMGFLELLFDPIVGAVITLMMLAFMIPLHVLFSKLIATITIRSLMKRQKQLQLTENLVPLFEKNLTFSRMMLPINDPVGWDNKSKGRLTTLLNKAKDLVQSLNDNFSLYNIVATTIPVIQAVAPVIQTVIPVIVEIEPVVAVAPVIVETQPVVQAEPIASSVQLSTQSTTEPQRKSALMQKFTRK